MIYAICEHRSLPVYLQALLVTVVLVALVVLALVLWLARKEFR